MDSDRFPVALRTGYVVHVAYKRAIIKYALENFPAEFGGHDRTATDPRHYGDNIYQRLGIE
jgi:hypothetical protein